MSDKKVSIQVGPGIQGLLGLLFIALKLTGYIDWSWWLVLLPFYIIPVIALALLTCYLIVDFCVSIKK